MQKRNILNTLFLLQIVCLPVLFISCEKEKAITLPVLSTSWLTDITPESATCGVTIISDGGEILLNRGICWSTHPNPTVSDFITSDGVGSSSYVSKITGLRSGTHYYIRAYATNSEGTAYGNEIIFITPLTDIEGNLYNTVRIGDQVWMRENLRTTKYNDNTNIPVVTENALWITLTSPACSWYLVNESDGVNNYGVLYNWFAVNTDKLCPSGWHVPDEDEWNTLVTFVGGAYYAGGILKEQGTGHWTNPNYGASDYYGFTALPGGFRTGLNTGSFRAMGYLGRWWVNTDTPNPWWDNTDPASRWARCRTIFFDSAEVILGMGLKTNGYSVRCVKD
ncbi:MAG TPA: hypothetical protein DEO60_05665 [Bacteroidales bacterium]|nr:hypothetical protein [Bacteroidales bacterium]HBZ20596.1 hypothetical protein [Bacteroidales bacterium]